jgi:hypothetical protein
MARRSAERLSYVGQNQISVMRLASIAEVQIVLPAEYGGVAGGQISGATPTSKPHSFPRSASRSFRR